MKGVRYFVEVFGQCLRRYLTILCIGDELNQLRKFIQSLINRINSEIHLEKKQKAFNKGKHEPLIRIIEPPWKITECFFKRVRGTIIG